MRYRILRNRDTLARASDLRSPKRANSPALFGALSGPRGQSARWSWLVVMETLQTNLSSQWLTVRQAAQRLTLCRRVVWNLVKCGELPAARVGRRLLISAFDLDAFVASRRVIPKAPPVGREAVAP